METSDGKSFFVKDQPTKKVKVGPAESMSKSKKNTIDPESMIENFGADAVRLFILSDSPPEKDVQWSEQGMVASHKFVQKLWLLNCKIKEKIRKCSDKKDQEGDLEIERFTNQLIFKMNNNLEKFNYNVIIANMHETYNFLIKILDKEFNQDILIKNFRKILSVMYPVIPHIINECVESNNFEPIKQWPEVDKSLLDNKRVSIVVQIDGKKRGVIVVDKDTEEKTVMELISKEDKINKNFINKNINKVFFVKNRLINILIND